MDVKHYQMFVNILWSSWEKQDTKMRGIIKPKRNVLLKANAQLVQKMTFEPLMDFKQNHY